MNTPHLLVTNKSDQEVADEIRNQVIEGYQPLLATLNEAIAKGFLVNVTTGSDATGKQVITQLIIAKKF